MYKFLECKCLNAWDTIRLKHQNAYTHFAADTLLSPGHACFVVLLNQTPKNMLTQQTSSRTLAEGIVNVTARRIRKTWNETPFDELEGGPKLTRSCVTNTFEGDIEGESWEEYLMVCQRDGSCHFMSVERVMGSLNGRTGSFVMQSTGTFETGIAEGNLVIVPDSGTGELVGITGKGRFFSAKGRLTIIVLECELSESGKTDHKD